METDLSVALVGDSVLDDHYWLDRPADDVRAQTERTLKHAYPDRSIQVHNFAVDESTAICVLRGRAPAGRQDATLIQDTQQHFRPSHPLGVSGLRVAARCSCRRSHAPWTEIDCRVYPFQEETKPLCVDKEKARVHSKLAVDPMEILHKGCSKGLFCCTAGSVLASSSSCLMCIAGSHIAVVLRVYIFKVASAAANECLLVLHLYRTLEMVCHRCIAAAVDFTPRDERND